MRKCHRSPYRRKEGGEPKGKKERLTGGKTGYLGRTVGSKVEDLTAKLGRDKPEKKAGKLCPGGEEPGGKNTDTRKLDRWENACKCPIPRSEVDEEVIVNIAFEIENQGNSQEKEERPKYQYWRTEELSKAIRGGTRKAPETKRRTG